MAMQPEEQLEGASDPVKEALSRKRLEELKALAKDQNVDIAGLVHKGDIIDALALHPGIGTILGVSTRESDVPSLEEIMAEGSARSVPEAPTPMIPSVAAATERSWTAEASPTSDREKSFNELLSESLAATVDFSRVQGLLKEVSGKFQARNYDNVISIARDSVLGIDEVTKRFLKTAWAYAISASLKIIEDSERNSDAANRAHDALEEAKRSFTAGNYIGDGRTLERLHKTSVDLFNYEVQKARQHVQAQEAALEQIQAMGGDTGQASEVLSRAAEALMAGDRARYLEVIPKADDLISQARNARIAEIKVSLASVEGTIKEAKSIGADVTEALQLHEQSRGSIQSGDFVNANKLIQRTERVALEAQKAQIDRVTELHRRQVEKAKKLILDTKPLIEKARAKGQDVTKALDLLRQAVECVNHGDYVNGLLHIREAGEAIKSAVGPEDMHKETPGAGPIPEVGPSVDITPETPEPIVPDSPPVHSEAGVPTPMVVVDATLAPAGGKGTEPRCPHCGSTSIEMRENGKGRCFQCGGKFRWGRR
jgi:hypothetical protein